MKLREYLDGENISVVDFAKSVGVTAEAVRLWIHGERRPRPEWMQQISDATDGRVGPADFFDIPEARAS